jgi:hypothetical protein
MNWRLSINQSPQSVMISDIEGYTTPVVSESISPIDTFYAYSQELLRVGDTEFLRLYPHLGGLLLVGLVSATENYFRDILSSIIAICPIAQAEAAGEMISLGSVIWHDPANALRGAFEHYSFTSSKNILGTCQKYTKIQINNSLSVLNEFDKVCELRHGLVHAGACVPGKNAIKLQIPSRRGCTVRINIGFLQLHEAGAVCTNLVTSINFELFDRMVNRWADDWRKLASWNRSDPAKEDILFATIWNLFYSTNDADKSLIRNPMTMEQCRAAVRQEYNLPDQLLGE